MGLGVNKFRRNEMFVENIIVVLRRLRRSRTFNLVNLLIVVSRRIVFEKTKRSENYQPITAKK